MLRRNPLSTKKLLSQIIAFFMQSTARFQILSSQRFSTKTWKLGNRCRCDGNKEFKKFCGGRSPAFLQVDPYLRTHKYFFAFHFKRRGPAALSVEMWEPIVPRRSTRRLNCNVRVLWQFAIFTSPKSVREWTASNSALQFVSTVKYELSMISIPKLTLTWPSFRVLKHSARL